MQEKFLSALIEQFDNSHLTELNYNDGDSHIILKKGGINLAKDEVYGSHSQANTSSRAQAGRVDAHSKSPTLSQDEVNRTFASAVHKPSGDVITAPIVGTFYAAPGPDSPPFVSKGVHVKKGQTLCVIEAMKMMNKLEAEFDCTIVDIKATSGSLVEFGQALFEVTRE